ncbi:PDR/VanB family oxidoreductase [Escherichia fergusonii]|uniref:PDR/VanB family oxidoreductase n=1 Tax=Escherichia fergusonii TaxID=564 RepID=UPI001CBB982E|nr:PDR/VanB family oxidoreductase [Escherichia fergusonii]MBZ4078063.1 oxidoreductase [Escherichia fergusonii]MBZ4109816.1 oxidoreductase [Escherichia fergusonii]MBZ4111508.1 oxidoreductase [Escherichia fergusonii]MBZ4122760.1 oxidoreductase [Escherichia fergusonii]MBZ4128080.1 oxidoreductase [Escherichia fergusonii]
MLTLHIIKRELQGEVVLLTLADATGAELPAFTAGAHVDLHLTDDLVRPYSLCGDPADRHCYQLGILKDSQSKGGSLAAHALQEGESVTVSLPRNLFALDARAAHSLLIGGGIGITPMLAMAAELHAAGRAFSLHYCARSRSQAAFVAELEKAPWADRVWLHFSEEQRIDLPAVLSDVPANTHIYVCGPTRLMEAVSEQANAAGYAAENVHQECFSAEVEVSGKAFDVVAATSGITVRVLDNQTIVEALAQAGLKVCVSCKQGICGSCLTDVIEGEPDHRDSYLTDEEKADGDQILLCCSRAKSARLIIDL